MNEITIDAAIARLMDACPGLYASLAADLREVKSSAYESNGAVIVKTKFDHSRKTLWMACDLGCSDLEAARAELNEHIRRRDMRSTYRIGVYSDECSLLLSRLGEPYGDPAMRILNKGDRKQILSALDTPKDDSYEGRVIAGVIRKSLKETMKNPDKHLLGLFNDGDLAGVLKLSARNEVICVDDVFVRRECRGRKYAPRLIRAAAAMYPGARYVYSCGSGNAASIASAQSAGFALAGTCKFGR